MKLEDQEWVINPNTGNKIDMTQCLKNFQLSMIYIDTNFPFFSSLARQLKYIWSFQVPTACTDGTRMIMNPEFMLEHTLKFQAFVVMHEIMHCSLDHMARGANHDHVRSNIAADYEVNGLLVADNVVKSSDIKGFYYDPKYESVNYEVIYGQIGSKTPPDMQKGGQQGSGTQGQGQSGQGGQQGGQGGQGKNGSQGGGGNKDDNRPRSKEWLDGWNKAIEDYKAGKIKIK